MDSSSMFIASVEPYRISDLEKLLSDIRSHPNVSIENVGHTVEGRPLEIIRIGKPGKRKSVFLRARAHAWEAGGNWVVEGFVRSLLADSAGKYLDSFTVYIMPMANKDGVARGKTRFNAMGMDLNRQWDREPDSTLVPEKYAFEQWLKKQIAAGEKPVLAMDLHNDNFGTLHVNLPTDKNKTYAANMARLEKLLRQHTWFTEGISHVKNPGSLGEGLAARYGIDACVYEFNYDWIAGLKKDPMGADWMQLGGKLREVFLEYLK
jgi:predicted deacylase